MTTVVACALDGVVWMAADTGTNVYDRPIPNGAIKIRRIAIDTGGEVLFGFCGSGALPDILEAGLKIEGAPDRDADHRPWAVALARAITALGIEEGLRDADGQLDGSVLVGFRGRLWTVSNGWAIPHPDGVAALGSGEGPAIGALDALLAHGVAPNQAVVEAAQIGITRDRFSSGPIDVHVLGPDD